MIYVENLASLIESCLTSPRSHGQIFNATDPDDLSTSDLLAKLSRLSTGRSMLIPFPSSVLKALAAVAGAGDVADRLFGSFTLDASKARTLLPWKPPFTLADGLARTVEWWQRERHR